ncbi:MAG: hypothetical protein Q9182_001644 [Xanthomendoza sp. 2 TL-2023]
MEKAKSLAKEGWHPKGKDGGRESWRGEHKGINQMAGWVGKGKTTPKPAEAHVSRPLATLKDPELFGPPPKNVNYHGGAAVPNAISPDRGGLGAPLTVEEVRAKGEAEWREVQAAEEAARKPAPPPVPYRVNTSGLSTSDLPKPPVRLLDHGGQSPASPIRPSTKLKPSLPPRLPPRQGSTSLPGSSSPPPPYSAKPTVPPAQDGGINQGAVNRLASAGVTVSAFGIGNTSHVTHQNNASTGTPADAHGSSAISPQLNELQSRFSKFPASNQDPASPSQGTSLADKQAAIRTAQSFRNDPSSVSLADARSTLATANNFRDRHGDQVNSGWNSANALNKKYDLANRASSYASQNGTSSNPEAPQSPSSSVDPPSMLAHLQKRAPPPPPQKPSFSSSSAATPPPVPLSSKPR